MGSRHAGLLHYSNSQLQAYIGCSQRFFLQYVEGREPSHTSGELVFGLAVHDALATFHTAHQKGNVLDANAVANHFRDAFLRECQERSAVLWPDDESAELLAERGDHLVRSFVANCAPAEVVAVEQAFVVPA